MLPFPAVMFGISSPEEPLSSLCGSQYELFKSEQEKESFETLLKLQRCNFSDFNRKSDLLLFSDLLTIEKGRNVKFLIYFN